MTNDILYAYGFDGTPDAIDAEVQQIGPTDFNVVIIPFIHFHDGGSLFLNDKAVGDLEPGWAEAIQKLKTGYSVAKRVLVSIGGADNANDWTLLGEDMATVVGNLVEFAQTNGIDGFDFDFEGGTDGYGEQSKKTLAQATRMLKEKMPSAIVTAPPYEDPDFWAGAGGVLAQAAAGGDTPFDWWNVQFYAGDGVVPPGEYVSTFEQWSQAVGAKGNGVADGNAFVAPGTNGADMSAADFAQGLSDVRQAHPSISGGFVWEYTSLNAPAAGWASAISGALD